ncbi:zinc finger protein 341 isoform X2 [Halyomorpha halys]|uniref:zinc finger protein 341 isoform X2 n=1 Tax=Halyomorpha halys TaxID=286706 RepID=UPI0006D4FEF4|nr:zinc finger protein 341-like isoform X2 [Halyomorpha halys]
MAQIFYTTVPTSPSAQQSFEVELEQFLQSTVVLNTDVQDNSVVFEEGDSFQCGRCQNHFRFLEFIIHKRTCQGVQLNLTEEETEVFLSQPLSLTAVEDESNTDNNNQQIVIDNGELFSFTEEPSQNEVLQEGIDQMEDEEFQTSLDVSDIRIIGNEQLDIGPLIEEDFIIADNNKEPTEIILAEGNINRLELPQIVTSIANGSEDSENIRLELQTEVALSDIKENADSEKPVGEESTFEANVLKCTVCGKEFRKNFDLQQHIRSHTGERPFQCVVCGRAFAQKSNVMKHMATHKVWPKQLSTLPPVPSNVGTTEGRLLIEKIFACQYCTCIFDNYQDLKSHRKEHISQKVYKCVQKSCPLTFKELDAFLQHTFSHNEKASYECHICHKEYKSLDDLGQHQIFHEEDKSPAKQVSCCKCRAKFMSSESLEKHMLTDSHNYPCPNCDKVFACERFLRRHISIHSNTKVKYSCPECKKPFRSTHYLNVHKVIHTSEKPYICKVCSASFNRRDKLARHNLTHENAKRYKCPFKSGCNKKFNRKDKLKQHILTHSSWKKFACRFCSKAFSTVSHVDNHEFLCSTAIKNQAKANREKAKNNNVPTIEIVVFPVSKHENFIIPDLLVLSNENNNTSGLTVQSAIEPKMSTT